MSDLLVVTDGEPGFSSAVVKLAHRSEICQGLVNSSYLTRASIAKSTRGIVLAFKNDRKTNDEKNLLGFMIYGEKSPDTFYLDVICSSGGVGKQLMQKAIDLTRKAKKKYLVLYALPHVINFYRKLGFKNVDRECIEDPEITRLAETLQHKRYSTTGEWETDAPFIKFLEALRKSRLTGNKRCKEVRKIGKGCNVQGYVLTLCVK